MLLQATISLEHPWNSIELHRRIQQPLQWILFRHRSINQLLHRRCRLLCYCSICWTLLCCGGIWWLLLSHCVFTSPATSIFEDIVSVPPWVPWLTEDRLIFLLNNSHCMFLFSLWFQPGCCCGMLWKPKDFVKLDIYFNETNSHAFLKCKERALACIRNETTEE